MDTWQNHTETTNMYTICLETQSATVFPAVVDELQDLLPENKFFLTPYLSTTSFLSSSRLWVVCLLRGAVWYLQYDDTDGDCGGPVCGDHQASGLPGVDVSQESPEHPGCCLGLLRRLEPAPLLRLEWVQLLVKPSHCGSLWFLWGILFFLAVSKYFSLTVFISVSVSNSCWKLCDCVK